MDCVPCSVHSYELTYRPGVRAEGDVRGNAPGKDHYAQFIQKFICFIASERPPAIRPCDNIQWLVGKEWRHLVNGMIENILEQLARQLVDPVPIIRKQGTSKSV